MKPVELTFEDKIEATSTIYKATDKSSGKKYFVKIPLDKTEKLTLHKFEHENIVKDIASDQSLVFTSENAPESMPMKMNSNEIDTSNVIIMKNEGDEVFKEIENGGMKDDVMFVQFVKEIFSAVETIHSEGYAHYDIKPENIILNKNEKKFVLIDFDLASQDPINIVTGSLTYRHPAVEYKWMDKTRKYNYGALYKLDVENRFKTDGFSRDKWAMIATIFTVRTGHSIYAILNHASAHKIKIGTQKTLEDRILFLLNWKEFDGTRGHMVVNNYWKKDGIMNIKKQDLELMLSLARSTETEIKNILSTQEGSAFEIFKNAYEKKE
jgi:serine/threonine protein kinase